MGISGLLPLLRSISTNVHISAYSGKTLAIDAYCWLHKGVYTCSLDLALGNFNNSYVSYCLNRIDMLLKFNIKPLLVFDGDFLPTKKETECKRQKIRDTNSEQLLKHMKSGRHSDAYSVSQKCIDVTPTMANHLIKELKRLNIQFVVAPYEADAQMAYLSKINECDAIISEDSDLLLFSCKKVLYKLDNNGSAVEIRLGDVSKSHEFSFPSMTLDQFRQICILSGCDYLESLPGIGLKSAIKLMKKYHKIENVLNFLKITAKSYPPDYERRFWIAFYTFQHQTVYDCHSSELVPLNPILDEDLLTGLAGNLDFLGPRFENHIAKNICTGILHPITKIPIELHGIMSPKKLLPAAAPTLALPSPLQKSSSKRIFQESDENSLNCLPLPSSKLLKASPYFTCRKENLQATNDAVLTPANSQTSLLDFFEKRA